MKKVLALVLTLAMCLGCVAFAEEDTAVYQVGSPLPDFTFTDITGVSHTLSETLKEKEMVLINLWATWCGPCEMEFPYLEEAYEEYSDKVAVFALSVEETDDDATLTDYATAHGMTFPIGRDESKIFESFGLNGIPTSIVVDRFGNVVFLETGSQPSTDAFERLFNFFLGDEYTESKVLDALPMAEPTVDPISEEELSAALNVEGTETPLQVYNDTDAYTWPMLSTKDGDRTVLMASNTGVNSSLASVLVKVDAKAGDVFAVDYKVSSEAGMDVLTISVNGKRVKAFGGEKDWATYGYEFAADGTYEIALSYLKDQAELAGEDVAYFDNARLVSGDEAAAVLAGNPAYPAATKTTTITVTSEAKQVFFTDPTFGLMQNFGMVNYYIMNAENGVDVKVTLAEGLDPETIVFCCEADGSYQLLTEAMGEDGYYIKGMPIDTNETTGYSYTTYYLLDTTTAQMMLGVIGMADEKNANAFMKMLNDYEIDVPSWKYADGTLPSTDEVAEAEGLPEGMASYTIGCVDQNGDPVTGVMINVCTDEACTPMPVDENGILEFTSEAYPYVLHVLIVPEGYEFDTTVEEIAPEEGGDVVFVFQKV